MNPHGSEEDIREKARFVSEMTEATDAMRRLDMIDEATHKKMLHDLHALQPEHCNMEPSDRPVRAGTPG
jgi:hypothetical protein